MRKTLTAIAVILALSLCGCAATQQDAIESDAEITAEADIEASMPNETQDSFYEPVNETSSAFSTTAEESSEEPEAVLTAEPAGESTPEPEKASQPTQSSEATETPTSSSLEPVSEPTTSTEAPVKQQSTESAADKPATVETTKPVETATPTESEPTSTPEPSFDIGYWISYAKSTAVSLGLTLESSAVDCWDNPITANPDCIYLERDISARLSRYASDEDITDVWVWYECVGTNSYLIYVGYA
jgi:chemotaxis protein histidine kinase CheA